MKRLWNPHKRPPGCDGCPRNKPGLSTGFVPGFGDLDAELIPIGEQPGPREAQEGKPFVYKSGDELNKGAGSVKMFKTNVRKCLGGKYEAPALRKASIAHCVEAYLVPELKALTNAKTILTIGRDSLEVVVGAKSAIKWHGSVLTKTEADTIREVIHEAEQYQGKPTGEI